MSDPFWRGPFDGFGGKEPIDKWTRLQESVASRFIDQIASAPSPSDRLAQQRRDAALNKPFTRFDNVGAPNGLPFQGTAFGVFDGNSIRPFDPLTQLKPTVNGQIANPGQIRTPVLIGDPNRPPPEYPGQGIGPDGAIIGRVVGAGGAGPRLLWELFTKTYNSRARENVLPGELPLPQVAPEALAQVHHWMLMGDSDLSQPRGEYNNRNLRPGPEQKGHIFAVGINKDGNPINVLEFYWGESEMTYYGQFQIAYSRDNQGAMHTRIAHYNAVDQTSAPGPKTVIGNSLNTYEGTTEYITNNQNQLVGMRKFDYINNNVPQIGFDFSANGARMIWRDPNSGRQMDQPVNNNMLAQTVKGHASKFYFRNLFGP